jgi:hypothetical protein
MHKFLNGSVLAGLAAAMLIAAPASASVFVSATSDQPILLANLTAGTTYTLTATGVANIYDAGALDFDANGAPTHVIGGAYAAFNTPGCCYSDPTNSSSFGPAGLNGLLGSLVGSYVPHPTAASDYFQLGANVHFTASSNVSLYGLVNDAGTAYGDNRAGTGFTVTVRADSPAGVVPEPASWALMILGFGGVGVSLRRRSVRPAQSLA